MQTVGFAEQLATSRKQRGYTQAVLAERAGIHMSQLHRYEAGTAQPTLDVIRRLAVALSVSTDSLIFGTTPRSAADARLAMAFEATASLDKHDRTVIAELIEAFLAARDNRARPNNTRGPKPKNR